MQVVMQGGPFCGEVLDIEDDCDGVSFCREEQEDIFYLYHVAESSERLPNTLLCEYVGIGLGEEEDDAEID